MGFSVPPPLSPINESLQLGEIPEAVREGAHAVLRHVERSEPPQRTQLFRELGELVVVQENFLEKKAKGGEGGLNNKARQIAGCSAEAGYAPFVRRCLIRTPRL